MVSVRGAEALEELRIRFRQIGADRYLVLANGPAPAADVIEWKPRVEFVEELDDLFKEAFGQRPRVGTGPIDARLTTLGRELFDALLPRRIRDALQENIRIAEAEDCELRVRFDLPPALSDLPVEILCPPQGDPIGGALALKANLSVVRSVPVTSGKPRLAGPEDDQEPLSVLVVVASPDELPPLDVSAELDRLEDTLSDFMGFDGVVLDILGGPGSHDPVTLTALSNRVMAAGSPLAVLLIAHGETSPDHGQACVVLESDNGSPHRVPADRLAGTLGNSRRVRFVALNLCVGARVVCREPLSSIAQAIISNGIPAVVGMSTEVTDEAGARFSAPLFRALSSNATVDDAVQAARNQMENITADTRIEWCAPVLCMADGCPRGQLFKVRSIEGVADPLRDGLEITNRLTARSRPSYEDLAPAARFHRATGEWLKMRDVARAGMRRAKDKLHRAHFRRLEEEACIELAIEDITVLCQDLAKDHPPAEILPTPELRGVPQPVMTLLEREVARANELRHLHERYTRGLEALRSADWVAASKEFEPCGAGQYRDSRQLLAYAKGRSAEAEARWAEARDTYAEVGDALPDTDTGLRLSYVAGRAAEQAGDWPAVSDAYAALPPGYQDCEQRLPYARGRAAEQAGDWPGAVAVFGSLPDTYHDVALRRSYATARIAASEQAWNTVVEVLADLDDGFQHGDLGRLRSYAQARRAEENGHWDRATEIYQALGDTGRDVPERRCYAQGRAAQDRADWALAVTAYQELPGDYRDAATRHCQVSARQAEQNGEWQSAVHAYQAIPEHPDTADRLPYALACEADSKGDWQVVIEALDGRQVAEDLRAKAALLTGYARGRLAEEAGRWMEAAASYLACGAYGDAPTRAVYLKGRDLEDRAEWSEALSSYESVAGAFAPARRAALRLASLRQALPWMDGLPSRDLIEDPSPGARHASPYQALRAAGITPHSTAQEVKDGSFVLMTAGLWTPQARMAWDRLRSVPDRLEADALLYQLADGQALCRAQRDLAPGPPEELATQLQSRLELDAPLVLLLSARREAAITEWAARLRRHPGATDVAHALALAWTWLAVELGDATRHDDAATAWERAVAYWGRLLSDDGYWDGWRSRRASCYRLSVGTGDLSRARRGLTEWLSTRLAEAAERARLDNRAEDAERYRQLRLTFTVELAAARALAAAGGVVPGEEPVTVSCGPLFVGLHPELREPLARLAARLDGERPHPAEPEPSLRLRCAFSELGEALVLLERNQPGRALGALRGLHRTMLVDLPADCGHPLGADTQDCPECAEFLARDPGHAGLRHRRTRVLQDAVELATRALLALAKAALAEGGPGVRRSLERWQDAVDVAANIGASVRVKRAIVPVVLGRADVLKEERRNTRLTAERLTEAIDLVATVRRLVGSVDEGRLAAKQAELLTARGIWFGYRCYEYEEPSYPRAAADLRQALTLNPESLDTRDNLARGLVYWASSLRHQVSAGQQLRLLDEALMILHEGLLKTPGYALFRAMLAEALEELEQWCFEELSDEELDRRLRQPATSSMAGGPAKAEELMQRAAHELTTHPVAGVLTLITAVRSEPGPVTRQRLTEAVTGLSGRAEWSGEC